MKRFLTSACLLVAAWAAGAACSSSSQPSAAGPASGADASGPSDSGPVPITEVNGDAAGPMPIMCGGATCTAPSNGLVPLSPCCLPDNGCGATFGSALAMFTDAAGAGSTCVDTSAGTPDPACPSQVVMGMMLAGCCAVSGMCGLDLSPAGLGCNPLSALSNLPLGMDSAAPQPCSAAGDAGAPRDAAGEAGAPRDAADDTGTD